MTVSEEIMQFSELKPTAKHYVIDMLNEISQAKSIQMAQQHIKTIFRIMAPNADYNQLMSSTKDYRLLKGCGVQEARAGLHVMRTYLAQCMHMLRQGSRNTADQKLFDNEGIAVINFPFKEEAVEIALEEFKKYPLATSKNEHNLLRNNSTLSDLIMRPMYDIVTDLLGFKNTEVDRLFLENTFVQKLCITSYDNDIQKVMHQDTFFPCIKWWWFPEEHPDRDGTFNYARRSQQGNLKRLEYIYNESINIAEQKIDESKTPSHIEGSLRISDTDLYTLGYQREPICTKRNTLVVANVFGFHARGQVGPGKKIYRDAVHGSIRISRPLE